MFIPFTTIMGKNSQLGPFSSKFLYYDDHCTSILRIPSRLVTIYGDDLARMATLRIKHSQKFWKVSVEKIKGQHFFTKGWKEFALEAGMKTGEYLLFRAAGLCEFHVSPEESDDEKELTSGDVAKGAENSHKVGEVGEIRGRSRKTTEPTERSENLYGMREHAEGPGNLHVMIKHSEGSENSNKTSEDTEEPDKIPTMCEHAEGPENSHQTSQRTEEPEHIDKTSDIAKGPGNVLRPSGHGEGPNTIGKTSGHAEGAEKSHANTRSEKDEQFSEEEIDFRAERRWRFMKKLKKHNANKLDIPRHISMVIEKTAKEEIKLRDYKGRKWPVSLEYRKCGAYTMTSGWLDFLAGNKVYVGSMIVFEFIPSMDGNVIEAQVIENGENGKELFVKKASGKPRFYTTTVHVGGTQKSHGNEDHLMEEEIYDKYSGVVRRWTFSKKLKKHDAYKLDIPRDVSKVIENAKTGGEIKLQDRKGRKWPVRLQYRTCGAYTMVSGWIDFLVGNKVYVGSTVSFEFIPSKEKNVIEAWVIENGENGMELFVKKASRRPRFHTTTVLVGGTQKSHGNVKSGNEDHLMEEEIYEEYSDVVRRWTFSKKLKKHDAYKLNIPRDVSKVIENAKTGEIKLQDCKGRKWPVRLEYRTSGAYTMISGWIDFLVGNKVYVGSTVSFEFIPSKDKNVIEAWVTENGEKGTESFIKRAQGRPPCQ